MYNRSKKKFLALIITAVFLFLAFVLNAIFAYFILPHDEALTLSLSDPDPDSPIYVTMVESKDWLEDAFFSGGQYDFTFYNQTGTEISGWSVVLPLTNDIRMINSDDIWNVDFTQEKDTLTLTPDEFIRDIKNGESKTFGMIIVGDAPYNPSEITVNAHLIYHPTELPSFFILFLLSIIWFLLFLTTISEIRILRKTRVQEKIDKEIILETMSTFTNFIDAKDPYTKGHSQRVATVARELAKRMGLDEKTINHVYYAGILHDSGKIGIPDSILKKVGILTPEEYKIIQTHARIGGQMLSDFTSIDGIRDGALYHHERYDGTGYPEGLSGEDIPLFGRIICVADTYDAMARDRCYRKHLKTEKIISEFKEHAGKQFDPKISELMVDMINDGTAERLTADL